MTMKRALVFGYLLTVLVLMLYLVASLWMVEVKDTAATAALPVCGEKKPADGTPQIVSIEPASIVIGGNRGNVSVRGCNFAADVKVKLNGIVHESNPVSDSELSVLLAASELVTPGSVAVSVSKGAQVSNTVHFAVRSPADERVSWQVFCRQHDVTLELRLMLLVLFVGALAACVAALRSFADYAGDAKLEEQWYWLYISRPFVGAGLAFIFFLVIRAGFLAGTAADIKAVNPFGLAGVAALVAMFSDKAMLKLGDIFDTLFKTDDTRGAKLKGPAITTPSPLPLAKKNQAYPPLTLTAQGGTPPYTWTVGALPPGLSLANDVLSGTPTADQTAVIKVTVKDSTGATATKDLSLTIQA